MCSINHFDKSALNNADFYTNREPSHSVHCRYTVGTQSVHSQYAVGVVFAMCISTEYRQRTKFLTKAIRYKVGVGDSLAQSVERQTLDLRV